ncbi:hypothetical protein LOTGIDRAFT_162963 [Lottia gigantea]|uniref:Uncharacterized protein n=1 Tax=Lottia gigantea TaxID=225164 RepID=V4BSK9_LOTGI|nr:hypothetical protein LOTGIDRAFT_162963 [Lottia gigantea]ESO91959.1 hypothetical protein LOTGIDRAFT_162963 [Lottia gigantea]
MNLDLEFESNTNAPPINNALVPDIYNRLDAEIQERTRVFNTLLEKRLMVQEKVLNKHKHDVKVSHDKETFKIRRELSRIRHSLPTVGLVHGLNNGLAERAFNKRKMNPLYMEKNDMPFCERHLLHFLPNKRKYYKKSKAKKVSETSKDKLPTVVNSNTQPEVETAAAQGRENFTEEQEHQKQSDHQSSGQSYDQITVQVDTSDVLSARSRIERRLRYSSPAKL